MVAESPGLTKENYKPQGAGPARAEKRTSVVKVAQITSVFGWKLGYGVFCEVQKGGLTLIMKALRSFETSVMPRRHIA